MNSTIGAIITIILVIAWVVKGLSSVVGNENEGKNRQGRSLEEWDEIQTKRREAAQRQGGSADVRADASSQNPAQMTMAERIELARQRARQQAGLESRDDQQAEARRRARAQAEQEARQQREQAAQRQRAAQEQRARRERERIQQQRRRRMQAQADQEAQDKRRRGSRQQRRSKPQQPTRATTGSQRERVVAESMRSVKEVQDHDGPKMAKLASPTRPIGAKTSIGTLDRARLRKAFVMKELLDKPVALRDPQADLL